MESVGAKPGSEECQCPYDLVTSKERCHWPRAVFASCDKSPTSPRPPEQGRSTPVTTVTTVRIELVAPSEIAPGESVQLTANAIKSNGSVERTHRFEMVRR